MINDSEEDEYNSFKSFMDQARNIEINNKIKMLLLVLLHSRQTTATCEPVQCFRKPVTTS